MTDNRLPFASQVENDITLQNNLSTHGGFPNSFFTFLGWLLCG